MRRRKMRRAHRAFLAALLATCAFLPSALAATVDRVQVGRPGQNATAGFPLGLFVSVTTLPDYTAVGRFDGESRNWEGPEYRSPALPGGPSTLDWQATFQAGSSAAAVATAALVQDWAVESRPSVQIPHVVGGRRVGTVPAAALLTKAPGENNAQYESALAFPLCRGLFTAVGFSLLSPGSEYGTDPSDTFAVNGVPARQWNGDHALAALGQVRLEGYLPFGRLTARAVGRSVRGTLRDCRAHPMAGLPVRLLRGRAVVARARVAANGSFRLVAPGRGLYRVTAALTVTGKGGSGTRQDTRAVTVRVR